MNTNVNSVTIEDESSYINSDVELSLEILRFLCHEMGFLRQVQTEFSKSVVNVSKKRNVSLNLNGSEKGKAVDVDGDVKEVPGERIKFGPEAGKGFLIFLVMFR
ncbi:17125_t:CDS:2 [Gigaspora rosea]|nr:17125_t:CDS:2 [Gigaspora rosea]